MGIMDCSKNDDVKGNIRTIAQLLLDRRAGFLFGAGMSFESGAMTGSGLAASMLTAFLASKGVDTADAGNLAEKFPFEAIVEAYEGSLPDPLPDMRRYLDAAFGELKPHAGHKALAELACNIDRIYTTNFDSLIEDAFDGRADAIHAGNENELLDVPEDVMPVIHLHGVLGSGKRVMNESTVYADASNRLFKEFERDLSWKVFIMVGYSMLDPHIRAMYFRVRELVRKADQGEKKTYIVSPVSSKAELELAKRIWANRSAELVPLPATTFFEMLLSRVDSLKKEKRKAELTKRIDGSGVDYDKAAARLKKYAGVTDEDVAAILERTATED